jgi:hypothetical protein
MINMNNTLYPGRGIHNQKFLDSLKTGNLSKMLAVINADKDLDIQIRNDYLNIYYQGGNIAKVNSENSIEFDEFYFYPETKTKTKKEIEEDETIVNGLKSQRNNLVTKFKGGDFYGYFSEAKTVMNKWLEKNPKPERQLQHQLTVENQYNSSDYTIIDLEYEVSTLSGFVCSFIPKGKDKPKKPKFDIIAINKQGQLCVIELKKGIGALSGTSGLKEHWDCFQQSIMRNYQSFMDEMNLILKQKKEFGLLNYELEIKHPEPVFMFAYSYDDKDSIANQDKAFTEEYQKIGLPVHVIKLMNGSLKLSDK